MSCYLEIAIDTPLRRVFDYQCLDGESSRLTAGMRVRVPFGRRQTIGIVMKVKATTDVPAAKLKSITEILDEEPLFDSVLFDLLTWSADYYRHPIGEVLAAALPVSLRSGAPLIDTIEQWRLTKIGETEWATLPARNKRLRALASAIAEEASNETLAEISSWRAGLKELQSRGWIECQQVAVDVPFAKWQRAQPSLNLNDAQRNAVEKIRAACAQELPNRFRTLLLHGVTGSGKTEVYLQAIDTVIAAGKQALVLVPEIALTPQLVARFQERFNVPMAVLHSAVNETERLATWRAARNGTAPIVIGTRSAIFAPLKAPGIVIVDEEHDSSYKQQEGFRYSARDLAIVRAQRHNIPVVLGSATPSLESLARAKKQPDDLLALPTRAGNAQPARVRVVDLRKHAHTDGIAGPTMLTMKQHLEDGGQILLYLNRRGFAPVLFCPACGWSAACRRCDARMTVHLKENKLTCHHCGLDSAIPELCASCNAPAKPIGQGTERIEGTVARLFPGVTVARIDRDNIRRKGELEATLDTIHSGAVRILVGTQMLTKGHHFPNVTLVVVLNADQGLFGTDFRAAERLAQNIMQVAGRAGRAERSGEVLIQTEYPEHPLLMSLLEGGYSAFADSALRERESAHLPPYSRLALLRADANTLAASMNFLHEACEHAKSLRFTALRILGPVAAPMARKAGRYRGQLLFEAPSHAPLQKLLARLLPLLEASPQTKRVRWSIDVDPVELF